MFLQKVVKHTPLDLLQGEPKILIRVLKLMIAGVGRFIVELLGSKQVSRRQRAPAPTPIS